MNRRPDSEYFKDRICLTLKLNSSAQHPITSRKLQHAYNLSDVSVRQAVGLLRDDGEPIASGPKGFWYATNPHQLDSTIDNLKERIIVMERRRSSLIQAQNKMREDEAGQGLLFTELG